MLRGVHGELLREIVVKLLVPQMRFRCLAFLEQQVEELERAEQDRMEERQVIKQEAKKIQNTKTNTNTMAKIKTKGRAGSDGGTSGDQ